MLNLIKKIPFITVFWAFFYFLIFCLLLRNGFSYLDPDLGWHLRVGETITRNLEVPSQNIYNYTYTGNWVDHEWLSNYIVFQIFDNLGYPTLVISFVLIIIIVLILLNLAVSYLWREKGRSPPLVLIVIFQLFGVIACLPHFGVRIQELALLFVFLCLGIIYFYEKNKNWRTLLILIPLFYLWACLHASFLIGFFILFAFAGLRIFEKLIICSKFNTKLSKYININNNLSYRQILIFILVSLGSFVATIFTPYHFKLYAFLSGYSDTLYQSYIQEWFSQFSFPFIYWQLFYLCIAAFALFVYFYFIKKDKINLWDLFLFIVFFFLSFKSRRHFPLFFVVTFTFLIYIFGNYVKVGLASFKNFAIWLKIYLLFCIILTSVSLLLGVNFVRDPFNSRAYAKDYPLDALVFIGQHHEYDELKIFNEYGWGGFMIYNNPNRKIFIDGRLPQVTYSGHSFLAEYLEFFKSEDKITQKLNEYNIRIVLIKAKSPKIVAKKWEKFLFDIKDDELNQPNKLREYLSRANDWSAIYNDNNAIIYLKK